MVDVGNRRLSIIKLNLNAFHGSMLKSLSAATTPLTPKVAFKLLVYRECLAWRIVETAGGSVDLLESSRLVPAIIGIRSVVEAVAANHFLLTKLKKSVARDCASSLDDTAMHLLMGSRLNGAEFQSTNVLTMIDTMNEETTGIRDLFDRLSEFSHPNYSGVARAFSKVTGTMEVEFGCYQDGRAELFDMATKALEASLMLFESDYNKTADVFPKVVDLCIREFEEKGGVHQQ